MTVATGHTRKTRNKTFDVWRKCGQNATQTSKVMKDEYDIDIAISTITRWSQKYEWKEKVALAENEFKRFVRNSDDPLIRQLAMDDVEMGKVLVIMEKMVVEALRVGSRRKLAPRNSKELMELIRFVRDERERILKPVNEGTVIKGGVTVNDNRKIELSGSIQQLPQEEKALLLASLRKGLIEDLPQLQAASTAFVEDDEQ